MPVYEYECPGCEKTFEVQQRMADDPMKTCPDCGGEVTKLISRSSFQLKGGGWYADGYSQGSDAKKSNKSAAPPCQSGGGESCKGCPAASQAS